MKTSTIPFVCAGFLLILTIGCAQRASDTWTGWSNALKPKGNPGEPVTLAVDGKTDYVIVTPDSPTTQERKAAMELAYWLEQITGASFPIRGIPLLENGDFEFAENWGEKSVPFGWEVLTNGKYQPPARMQTGIHAVGRSGKSAYMPSGGRQGMQQTVFKTGTVWTLELDFASEDPPAQKHMDSSMYITIRNAQDGGILVLRVTDLDDDGKGELRFKVGASEKEQWVVLEDVVVFDDDVQKTPLVHHLKIEGRFDIANPYCDVSLTDPKGKVHEARGTSESTQKGDRPAIIRADSTPNTADHLLDNVQFIIPQKEVVTDRIISVGRTDLLKAANLSVAKEDLGDEGYAIAQQGQRLFLLGGKKRGPIYAALSLLEEDLGCRWYTSSKPGSDARINRIPKLPTLTFRPVARSYVPTFTNREPYYTVAWDPTWALLNRTNPTNVGIPEAWGGTFNYALHAHSLGTLMPPDEYFDEHPEYFMVTDEGQRISKQPCLTHPDVLKIVTANLLDILAQRPTAEVTMVSYNDGQSHCRCGPCMVLNDANESPQGAILTFVNEVAEEVEKHFPDVLICTAGYNETLAAPTQIRARHNVSVRIGNAPHEWRYPLTSFTTSDAPLSRHYREEIVKWSKICKTLQVWDYSANFSHFLAPMPNMHTFGPDMRFYADHNVKGIFMQGVPRIPGGERTPMRVWVMAKLFWDPDRDVHELVQDYIWGSWGEVAPQMAEYARLLAAQADDRPLDPTTGSGNQGCRYGMDAPFLTWGFVEEATRLFDEAEAAAQSEKMRQRVERARLPIMYVKLMRGPDFTGDTYGALIDHFQSVAGREGITWLGMHSGSSKVDTRMAEWRRQWEDYQQVRDIKKSEYEIVALSNEWRFAPDLSGPGEAQNWHAPSFNDSSWAIQRSDIRRGWEKQGFHDYRGVGWYRQTINIGDKLNRKHLYLYFTSVVEDAWIYLNGDQVLENTRESTGLPWKQILVTPFAVEVGDRLVQGQPHTLALRVNSNQRLGVYKPAYLLASDRKLETTAMSLLLNRDAGNTIASDLAVAQANLAELKERKKKKQAGGGYWKSNPYLHWCFEDEWAGVQATLKAIKNTKTDRILNDRSSRDYRLKSQ